MVGYGKLGFNVAGGGRANVRKAIVGAVIMVAVGAVASGVAVGLILLVNSHEKVAG